MGDRAIVSVDSVRVSPVFTVFDALSAADPRNVPAVEAVHSEMCDTTSPLVPAHVAHDGAVPD